MNVIALNEMGEYYFLNREFKYKNWEDIFNYCNNIYISRTALSPKDFIIGSDFIENPGVSFKFYGVKVSVSKNLKNQIILLGDYLTLDLVYEASEDYIVSVEEKDEEFNTFNSYKEVKIERFLDF